MADENIKVLKKETFLKVIENSTGTRLFNSLFVRFKDTGKISDVLNDGMYSCAFFVSSILYLLQAIDKPHATVKSVKEAFEKDKNWQKVGEDDIQSGDVIFWEKIKFDDGSENAHIGFALNISEAVSTDYKNKVITRHPIVSGNKRAVEAVFRYSWPDNTN